MCLYKLGMPPAIQHIKHSGGAYGNYCQHIEVTDHWRSKES